MRAQPNTPILLLPRTPPSLSIEAPRRSHTLALPSAYTPARAEARSTNLCESDHAARGRPTRKMELGVSRSFWA